MTNTKSPIRTAILFSHMRITAEFYVYAESNGLILAHKVGGLNWFVHHANTKMPIHCRLPRWNMKAKTKVAKFFDYLVAAPFPWSEWSELDKPPFWREKANAYVEAFNLAGGEK